MGFKASDEAIRHQREAERDSYDTYSVRYGETRHNGNSVYRGSVARETSSAIGGGLRAMAEGIGTAFSGLKFW
jgi:hypothetical protein